jgi:hypothetical protein
VVLPRELSILVGEHAELDAVHARHVVSEEHTVLDRAFDCFQDYKTSGEDVANELLPQTLGGWWDLEGQVRDHGLVVSKGHAIVISVG